MVHIIYHYSIIFYYKHKIKFVKINIEHKSKMYEGEHKFRQKITLCGLPQFKELRRKSTIFVCPIHGTLSAGGKVNRV